MRCKFSSSEAALLANGHAADVLTPWTIIIDTDEQTITVSKRNRILIGVDEDTLAFRFIRRVVIDQHFIGAKHGIIKPPNLKSISLVNTKIFAHVIKKQYLCATFLNDIHNKDYFVVKTFRVGGNSRPFFESFSAILDKKQRIICIYQKKLYFGPPYY